MSKKRLVGIVVGCIAVAIMVIVIAIGSPEDTREPEQIAVSAYDLAAELLDAGLTSLARQGLWEDYAGKQVKWTNELQQAGLEEGELIAYFRNPLDWELTVIRAVFDESQRARLLALKQGDLVTYTGVLASFEQAQIALIDCVAVSVAAPFWWNDDIDTRNKRIVVADGALYLGPTTYDHAHVYRSPKITAIGKETGHLLWEAKITEKDVLMGIDSDHVYIWYPRQIVKGGVYDSVYCSIAALYRGSGQIAWTHPYDTLLLPYEVIGDGVYSAWLNSVALREARDAVTQKGGTGLILQEAGPPLSARTCEYEGIVYESMYWSYLGFGEERAVLVATDVTTDAVLWTSTFRNTGMNDFAVVDGVLYVSTDEGVGAIKLPNLVDLQNAISRETGI